MEGEASVLVIYTGGTIGMLRQPGQGYVPHPGFLAHNLRTQARFHDEAQESVWANSNSVDAFSDWKTRARMRGSSPAPLRKEEEEGRYMVVRTSIGEERLQSLVTPKSKYGKRVRYVIWEYENLIDSAEVEMEDWIKIASDIERNYALYDSFVVIHGTDTMSYSASALSFLLEDLGRVASSSVGRLLIIKATGRPFVLMSRLLTTHLKRKHQVILTGAQIPLSEILNDSLANLLGALIIAGHYRIPEVCLFFNHKLLRGNRSIKVSSEGLDAFASPGVGELAVVGIDIEINWKEILRPGLRAFRAHKSLSPDVATLRIFPGITPSFIRTFLSPSSGLKGVVLHTYGAGNAPKRPELLSALREATERGVVIVNVTQCAEGAVDQGVYGTGKALEAIDITGGGDMTVECALAKLSFLLAKPDLTPAQIRKLISRPLRGELSLPTPLPLYSAPISDEDRLRSLLVRIVEVSTSLPSNADGGKLMSPRRGNSLPLDKEQGSGLWPCTRKDVEKAEKSLYPFLIAQASTNDDNTLLSSLIDSLSDTSSSEGKTILEIINRPIWAATGQTALQLAVISSQLSNVRLLLNHSASVHERDTNHHSILYHAFRTLSLVSKEGNAKKVREAEEIVDVLREAGAHLGEREIESGSVGFEYVKADRGVKEVWKRMFSEEVLERAKMNAKRFFD